MKKPILFSLAAFATVLLSAQVFTFSPSPAANVYEREQTHGNVRVVILKVEHATFLTSKGLRNPAPGKFYPVQTLGITYMVEALGDEPIKSWSDQSTAVDGITIGNIPARSDAGLPPNVLPQVSVGSVRPVDTYTNGPEELPASYNAARAVVHEILLRTQPGQLGMVKLNFKAGFNDKSENFAFEGVPLD